MVCPCQLVAKKKVIKKKKVNSTKKKWNVRSVLKNITSRRVKK